MASNNGGTEERRRRIAERGSDRMALITGRISTLPPAPPSTVWSPTHRNHIPCHAQSLSVANYDSLPEDDQNLPPRHSRPHSALPLGADFPDDLHAGEGRPKNSFLSGRLRHQGGFRYSNLEDFEFKSEEEPLIQDSGTVPEVNNPVSEGNGGKIKPPSVDTQQPKNPLSHKSTFFSSRELNSSIIASETTRALSSLIIALLVVFYYMISDRILASRPLYIVLLTDITIVLARLHSQKAKFMQETEGEKVEAPNGDGHNWGDAVKLMERGLVAYQAVRGVFIDCSIYIGIVVCATSLK